MQSEEIDTIKPPIGHTMYSIINQIFNITLLILSFSTTINVYSNSRIPHISEKLRFRTFSPVGGYDYDGIKKITQDSTGYIWVITDYYIFRFDGFENKPYLKTFQKHSDKYGLFLHDMANDSSDQLFFMTNNGLFKYNALDDNFDKISSEKSLYLHIGQNNDFFLASSKFLKKISSDTKTECVILYNNKTINNIFKFQNFGDSVLFSNARKIYLLNNTDKNENADLVLESDDNIIDFKLDKDNIWILTQKGISIFNLTTKNISSCIQFNDEIPLHNKSPRYLIIDKNKNIWVGTQEGLFIINPANLNFQEYIHSSIDPFSLPNSSVWTMTKDSQENIWIGTFSGGLCYANLSNIQFMESFSSNNSFLKDNNISCFAENDKYLMIGSEGGGISYLNKEDNIANYIGINEIGSNNIKSILLYEDNKAWIATYRGGLNLYNLDSQENKKFIKSSHNNGLLNNNLRKILADSDLGLYIAYQFHFPKISFLSFDNYEITHYDLHPTLKGFITDIIDDRQGNLWITTFNNLYRFDKKTKKSEVINTEIVGALNAQCLYSDLNYLWIGTIGGGYIKYNYLTQEISIHKDILDFNISTIYSFNKDPKNYIWIGTNNGLIRYDEKNNKFLEFDESEGSQGNNYYPLSTYQNDKGEIYFGGSNGYTSIYPDSLKTNNFIPTPIISEFYINNEISKPNLKNKEPNNSFWNNKIILSYNDKNFGFKFSSDSFLFPEKNKFKYRLKGYNDEWRIVNSKHRIAYYAKVPSGNYQFQLSVSNNDHQWSEIYNINIEVLSPFWLTPWAYFIYFSIITVLIFIFLRYYYTMRQLKMNLFLENIEKEKNEEIHQTQLDFFTNISHDFRTPLSMIMALLDTIDENDLNIKQTKMIRNNTYYLLNLINELLDFRTIEKGKHTLSLKEIDVNSIMGEISQKFEDYINKCQISFSLNFDSVLSENFILVDTIIIERVISNLLSNATKYTKSGGRILVETYLNPTDFSSKFANSAIILDAMNNCSNNWEENYFCIAVRDTGDGIGVDLLSKIFDQYYKSNTKGYSHQFSSGIGLALTKQLVKIHKGQIKVYSEVDKGTDIVIYLPKVNSFYSEDEIKSSEYNNSIEQVSKIKDNTLINTGFVNNINDNIENDLNNIPQIDDLFLRNKKQVLIVEDNTDLRKLVCRFLSKYFHVVEAEDGNIALEILQNKEIDIIISDIMMPFKDGICLLKEVKSNEMISHIPFILLSAKVNIESKLEGSLIGADFYFEKPINLKLLTNTIYNILSRQEKLRNKFSKTFFSDTTELSSNQKENAFLKDFVRIIDSNLNSNTIDIDYLASEMKMSRSKLYSNVKKITGKTVVEFILQYKLRLAAQKLIETNDPICKVIEEIGIKSQSYFTNVFKKEFGITPSAFSVKYRSQKII